ncbi:MAG TPA: ribose 5-phosphate isomerase A [Segetibacter sp.]|nr:ribose 5-phosphate isomerase A [Segetibacter sp.]
MDLKKQAAEKALSFIEDKSVVGLGAGSTIAHLVEFLEKRVHQGMTLQFVTSSYSTLQLLQNKKLPVSSIATFQEIDIYFDGCDQVDKQLNALKSGGGIRTHEKLLARMAKQFILIGDEAKLVETFNLKYPLVLEILPQAQRFVPFSIKQIFPGVTMSMRLNDKRDGAVLTENGNYLLDVFFTKWPALDEINDALKNIVGIVETSLFYQIASKAIVASEKGIIELSK